MAILRISTVFAQLADELPPEEKVKLTKVFLLLTDNPRHPSLDLKKLEGARRVGVFECRLDSSWRIILQRIGETTYDLIYVGPHDEALSFGTHLRERCDRYGEDPAVLQVRSYLLGDDTALEFRAAGVTLPGDAPGEP